MQIFEGSFTIGAIGYRGMLKDALDEYLSAATEGKPRNNPRETARTTKIRVLHDTEL
jgi:hypothetical protein